MKTLKSGNAIIHISATGDDDYVARTKDITVTVEKRKISVITNNKSMTVNGMIPTFDVTTVILPAVTRMTRYLKELDLSNCYRLTNTEAYYCNNKMKNERYLYKLHNRKQTYNLISIIKEPNLSKKAS